MPARPRGVIEEVPLAGRLPFDVDSLFAFLAARVVPGVEHWDGVAYRRSMALPRGHGTATLRRDARSAHRVLADVRIVDRRDLPTAVQRVRRMLDLDVDPIAVDTALSADPVLAPVVAAAPGRRVPGSVDPFETAVRAVVGQQISVAGARTILGRIVASIGAPLAVADDHLTHVFPDPARLAAADPALLPMPAARRRTLVELAARSVDGRVVLDAAVDRDALARSLLEVPGIGPWTLGYVLMRGLGDPDVFLPTDLGARRGMARLGVEADHAERWRPWRSYALHHLWAM